MAVESMTSPFLLPGSPFGKRDVLVQTFWQGQDLTDFPVMIVSSDMVNLYRAHGVSKGAWWYATYPPDEGFGGRFDLPKGEGTEHVMSQIMNSRRSGNGTGLGS